MDLLIILSLFKKKNNLCRGTNIAPKQMKRKNTHKIRKEKKTKH